MQNYKAILGHSKLWTTDTKDTESVDTGGSTALHTYIWPVVNIAVLLKTKEQEKTDAVLRLPPPPAPKEFSKL